MSDQNFSKTLWLQYLQALQGKIQASGGLEILNPPPVWNWGGKDSLSGLPYAQYLTLNQVPASPGSNTMQYGAKNGFGQMYNLMLRQIDETPGQSDPEYQTLNQDITDAEATYNQKLGDAQTAYVNYQSNSQTTDNFTTWLNSMFGEAYKSAIGNASLQVQTANTHLADYLASKSGPVKDAIKAYTSGLVAITDPDNPLTNTKYPGWECTQKPYDYVKTITNNNFGGDATNGSSQSFTITHSSSEYDYSKTWGEADLGLFGDFFLFDAGGKYTKVTTSSFQESYSINFAFQDITSVKVGPGAWFTPSMTALAKSATFFEHFSAYQNGSNTYFFGEGGELARMLNNLIVGYRPTITIEGGQSFSDSVKQTIEGGGGLMIGPFIIGGEGGSTTEKDTYSFDGGTITAKSNSDWPSIIATVSNWVENPSPS